LRYLVTLILVLLFGVITEALIEGHRAVVRENGIQHGLPPGNPHALDSVGAATLPVCPRIDGVFCIDSNPPRTYLEYKADGTVWALWPDGRFIQVVPK
jgi:hypothetical protein